MSREAKTWVLWARHSSGYFASYNASSNMEKRGTENWLLYRETSWPIDRFFLSWMRGNYVKWNSCQSLWFCMKNITSFEIAKKFGKNDAMRNIKNNGTNLKKIEDKCAKLQQFRDQSVSFLVICLFFFLYSILSPFINNASNFVSCPVTVHRVTLVAAISLSLLSSKVRRTLSLRE